MTTEMTEYRQRGHFMIKAGTIPSVEADRREEEEDDEENTSVCVINGYEHCDFNMLSK